MNESKLGNLISDDMAGRDAIHVAIAPVVAAEQLFPGQRIGLREDGTAAVSVKEHIGIVDPFLTHRVDSGTRFYMCLFPGTITSLRHEWTHPAFVASKGTKAESEEWIKAFAAEINQGYKHLMDAATRFVEEDYYTTFVGENEDYKYVDDGKWTQFWKHFEIVTGIKTDKEYAPFSCSC